MQIALASFSDNDHSEDTYIDGPVVIYSGIQNFLIQFSLIGLVF